MPLDFVVRTDRSATPLMYQICVDFGYLILQKRKRKMEILPIDACQSDMERATVQYPHI